MNTGRKSKLDLLTTLERSAGDSGRYTDIARGVACAVLSAAFPAVVKLSKRFFREMIFNLGQERLGQIAQFLFAHAGNTAELAWRRRITSCHLAQRDIGENHVSGDIAFV